MKNRYARSSIASGGHVAVQSRQGLVLMEGTEAGSFATRPTRAGPHQEGLATPIERARAKPLRLRLAQGLLDRGQHQAQGHGLDG